MDMSLSNLQELMMDGEALHAAVHGVTESRTRLSTWPELHWSEWLGFLGGSVVKNPPAMQWMKETWVWSLFQEDPWRRKWQPTPLFLPQKIPQTRSLLVYSPKGNRVRRGWTHIQLSDLVTWHNVTKDKAELHGLTLGFSLMKFQASMSFYLHGFHLFLIGNDYVRLLTSRAQVYRNRSLENKGKMWTKRNIIHSFFLSQLYMIQLKSRIVQLESKTQFTYFNYFY